MTKLIATSVVRGSNQGESHGGVFLIDLETKEIIQTIDWNTSDIDWQGRGWDRGLRGIAFHNETIYIVASDELFAYDKNFNKKASWKNPYLKHCHEICVYRGSLFITSTGFDSLLAFHLEKEQFHWAIHVRTDAIAFTGTVFDPNGNDGPIQLNKLHINNIYCDESGMYVSGLNTGGLLQFNGEQINMNVTLPPGSHNARPYKDGVLFNDTKSDVVRYVSRNEDDDRAFNVPKFDSEELRNQDLDETGNARAAFGRGLCVISDGIIAAGSSPSTISIHDLNENLTGLVVSLTNDVRHAIHGLEVWPY